MHRRARTPLALAITALTATATLAAAQAQEEARVFNVTPFRLDANTSAAAALAAPSADPRLSATAPALPADQRAAAPRGAVINVLAMSVNGDTPTPTDNDYTRINNALQGATNGDTIQLRGTFDWTETNAATSWVLGSDGTPGNGDDYGIEPPPLSDVTVTAAFLGDARIQGPGDISGEDLTGVFVLEDGEFPGWTFSNLEIFDFELSIGMFFFGAATDDSFDGVTVTNNHIRMPNDLRGAEGDPLQNIAIQLAFGDSQTISDNLIEIPGNSSSDGGDVAASVALQSNGGGSAARYDGLRITDNEIRVLNAQTADPEFIFGIWENGSAHGADIEIAGNQFLNMAAGNDSALNRQMAFRITSQSEMPISRPPAPDPSVRYLDNVVEGANLGFKWIEGFGTDWDFSPWSAVLLRGNSIIDSGTAIAVRSAGEAWLECNRIVGNTTGVSGTTTGIGLPFEDAEAIDAADNWWGCNQGPNAGDCDGTDGFMPTDLSTWFELAASTPGSTSLFSGEVASVDAALDSNSLGPPLCDVPETTIADFSAFNGTVDPTSAPFIAGLAQTVFTAGDTDGPAAAIVTVDEQSDSVAFLVTVDPTIIFIDGFETGSTVAWSLVFP